MEYVSWISFNQTSSYVRSEVQYLDLFLKLHSQLPLRILHFQFFPTVEGWFILQLVIQAHIILHRDHTELLHCFITRLIKHLCSSLSGV